MDKYMVRIAELVAYLLAKSYYITQLSRKIVMNYDNDCNDNFETNGEKLVQKTIVSLGSKNSAIFDVGANKGDWSSMLIDSGYRGKLFAIDPLEENLLELKKYLVNKKYDNYSLIQVALSNKKGMAKFYANVDSDYSGHDSMFDMREIGGCDTVDCIEVNTNTLDNIAEENSINNILFLKIDVEGNELSVLNGTQEILTHEQVEFIQIEFGHASRAARTYLHDIVNFINLYAYDIFIIKPKGIESLNFTPFVENRYSQINLLIVKRSSIHKLNAIIIK